MEDNLIRGIDELEIENLAALEEVFESIRDLYVEP